MPKQPPLPPDMHAKIFGRGKGGGTIYQDRNGTMRGGSDDDAAALVKAAEAVKGIKTLEMLKGIHFPPVRYIVPGLITESCVLLAGKPKSCKSWLALDIALQVARGGWCLGDRHCAEGDALYLALEDGERRMQARIRRLIGDDQAWPSRFHYAIHWPRADRGGVTAIDMWCNDHPEARLVVVDVLAHFRAPSSGKDLFGEDYRSIGELQEIATRRSVAILIVHHTRKGAANDPVEEISGTLGIAAAVDAFLVLRRSGMGATLIGRGRDTEDTELALQFGRDSCRWTVLGEAAEVDDQQRRGRALIALQGAGAEGLTPRELAELVDDISHANAKQLLRRMAQDGEITKGDKGRYHLKKG